MKTYYIAAIVPEEDGSGYSVYFPDVPNVCAVNGTGPDRIAGPFFTRHQGAYADDM